MPDNANPKSRLGWVKPGEPLGFVERLRKRGMWPLPVGRHSQHPRKVVTPFLIVPAFPGDTGGPRQLGAQQPLHFTAVEIVDSNGHPTATPAIGQAYILRCHVNNRGSAAAYGGIAEFYVAQPSDFDQAATIPGARMPAKGYTGFVVMADASVIITCPNRWMPATGLELTSSVLVHAYDPFIDPLRLPFDARQDRHVGRLDLSDFRGNWQGIEHTPLPPPPPPGKPIPAAVAFQIRLIITQVSLNVNVSIFQEIKLGQGLPANPQHVVTGRITSGQAQLNYNDAPTPKVQPTRFDRWTLTLPNADTLHFEHHMHFTRPEPHDSLTVGDLRRV